MDETDTPVTGPEVTAAEVARQWAEQRRAQARAQFTTPSWIGPARTEADAPAVPAQTEPDHDELDIEIPAPVTAPLIPETAHWSEHARPRVLAGTVLVLALAGVVTFLVLAIITQSVGSIIGLGASAFVAVVFRGALMGAGLTTVDLKGSTMRVRKRGVLDIVNLADPIHPIELVGTPDQSGWRLLIEAVDGRVIELGPREVDPTEMHRIVQYYRDIATREKRDRERRFNR